MNLNQFPDDARDAFDESAGLTQADKSILGLSLSLRPELVSDFRDEFDGLYVVVEDPVRNKFFSLGKKEFKFLSSLNRQHTVEEWVAKFGDSSFDAKAVAAICNFAINANLMVSDELDSTARLERQVVAKDQAKAMSRFNLISMKFKLFNPNELLKRIAPSVQWVFSLPFLMVWLAAAAWAASIACSDWERLCSASVGILSGYQWIWLLVIWVVLKLIHEAAHGIACRRYGGDVPEAGVLLLLFTPLAYVDVTSSWRFASRWHRIVVAGAGMYAELFIAFIALIVWSYQPAGLLADVCYNIVLMASVTTILFNANPLMRFDGYYMLSDALGVNNLYTKGTKWFGDMLQSKFFGIPQTANQFASGEKFAVRTYGTLAWFWKLLICVGLVIGASVLFQGAGKILGAIGFLFFFAVPMWSQIKGLYGPGAKCKPSVTRVALSMLLIASLLLCAFTIFRAPASKSAPAIVQFKDETVVRAESEGFIEEILVASGQSVSEGQVLMVLSNPKLELKIKQLESDFDATKIQARIHKRDGELALFQMEQEQLVGLEKQLLELKDQSNALTVRAPYTGFIFARGLESKIGSFASAGDSLLTIAEKQTKEIVVAIQQQDWESLKGKTGAEMRIALRSQKVFAAPISRIDPRATDQPRIEALCASAGGSIPVKQIGDDDGDSDQRLLSPHFYVDLALPSEVSVDLIAGQRGRAFFQAKRQSMGSYLWNATENWLKNKIEIATQTAAF